MAGSCASAFHAGTLASLRHALIGMHIQAISDPRRLWMQNSRSRIGPVIPPRSTASTQDRSNAATPGSDSLPKIPSDLTAEHSEMWALVQAAQAGDGDAFGKLYDRHVDSVFRFILYRIHDRALAEDFTSETFLRALRSISTLNYQGRDIGAWFMTIARNIVFDHTKSARFRLEMTTEEIPEGNQTEPGPELAVLTKLTNERLIQAVDTLGDEQKECIVLRFMQGLSVAETAAIMNKKDGAIKTLQHRALKRLSRALGTELL
jgi:RNA polymerase sigma-70 factor (ECF subfamily)